jgi:hypothetical protein
MTRKDYWRNKCCKPGNTIILIKEMMKLGKVNGDPATTKNVVDILENSKIMRCRRN